MSKNELQIIKKEELAEVLPPYAIGNINEIMQMSRTVERDDELKGCEVQTIRNSILDAVSMGLSPLKENGEAYFYSRNKKNSPQRVCVLHIGYRGYIQIAARSGWRIRSNVVYQNDSYDAFDKNGKIEYEYAPKTFGDRGNIIGAYAVAFHIDTPNHLYLEEMSIEEINKIEKMAGNSKAWKNWKDEMRQKSVIRRLYKKLPLTQVMKEIEARTVAEENEVITNDDTNYLEMPSDEPQATTAEIIEPEPELEEEKEVDDDEETTLKKYIGSYDATTLSAENISRLSRLGVSAEDKKIYLENTDLDTLRRIGQFLKDRE